MKRGLNAYRTTYGTEMRYADRNSILIEGREEICKVLLALRQSKDPAARQLSKRLWLVHTGYKRCKCCGTLCRRYVNNNTCWTCQHPEGFEKCSYEYLERLKAEAKKKWDSLLVEYETEK